MKWLILLLAVSLKEIFCYVANHHKIGRSHLVQNNFDEKFIPQKNFLISEYARPYIGSCRNGAKCVPFVSCPSHVRSEKKIACQTIGERKGVCCSTGQNHTEPFNSKDRHHIIKLDPVTLGVITRKSRDELDYLRSKEARLLLIGDQTILFPGSASYSHFRNSRRFDPTDLSKVNIVVNRALEIAVATKAFKNREGVANFQLELGMIEQDLRMTPFKHVCPPEPVCPPTSEKYQRIDGSCNNQKNSLWGASLTAYSRLLPPRYDDGIWAPPVSVLNGQQLPSPRLISTSLFTDNDIPHQEFTLLLMQFGQYLGHEITQSLDSTYSNGSAISCCSRDGWGPLPTEFRHYACMPIELPKGDPFFSVYKQGCMNFVRSVLAVRSDCTLGYAQQMNKVTHFIDGSSIYGSTPEQTSSLRSFQSGKLRVFNDYGRDLLPMSEDTDACLTMEQGTACFSSGDSRTNQMVTLAVLHTIFMREHNRIASILEEMNSEWEDEDIFLESRRIVVAELQVIVYKEFLPAILGDLAMEEFNMRLEEGYEYSFDYDDSVEPSVMNEFAAAAFRYGHSMVDGILKIYGMKRMEEMIAIPEVMFYPSQMRKRHFMDEILSTLTTEPIQEVDKSLPDALTKYLFRAGNPFGVDLAALNIQRGRDHGLRPYNDYRELSGLPRLQSFEEFGTENAAILKNIYTSVEDIDLWVGGLLEERSPGSVVGPVFRDIIAEQFSRLKKGDRYFFENAPSVNPGYFSPDQIHELRKASMSRIICDNSDGILLSRQARNAFRKPDVIGNEFVECSGPTIPRLNLRFWND